MTESNSRFLDVRGLRYHVGTWGNESAPKLFMLHGWMDVSASFQFLVDARQQHRLGVDHRDQAVDIEVRRGQQVVGVRAEDVHDVRRGHLEGRGDGAGLHRALTHRQCWTTRTLGLAVGHTGVVAGRETAAEPVNSICRATSHSGHGPAAIVTARDHRAVTSIRVPHVVGSNPSASMCSVRPPVPCGTRCGASAPVASACSVTPLRAIRPRHNAGSTAGRPWTDLGLALGR